MPVDVEVDSEAIELFAELRPVEVDVDSEATVLSVVDRPVESEPMPVDVDCADTKYRSAALSPRARANGCATRLRASRACTRSLLRALRRRSISATR
ncbi:hypothetical protein [Burkholderia pseudomallei]|uniref:hypothetical protein n=1 Tax=Burkholderia pseudomallei TaxID=28450 RepID=UPI00235DDFB9|nr:hypothetical protein [Burkholderia pseudomallei]